MSALQKVNLGTAPAGVDGDAVRTAFIKDNANVDVLNSQTFLTSATLITSAQALTTAHIGKRVNINLGSPGTINLPSASTCLADQVTLLRNLGTTVVTLAITAGSGDTVSISKLNPGEAALMDTDGLHAWTCLMRSRTNSDNETVNGNSTVVGNESVGGTLAVTGATTLAAATLGATSASTLTVSGTLAVTGATTLTGGITGGPNFSARPTFASNTPWDSGNLNPSLYALLGGAAFTGQTTVGGAAWIGCFFSARNSPSASYAVSAYASTQSGGAYIGRTDAAGVPLAVWCFGTTVVGSITSNGSSTTYGTTSDYRLKTKYRSIVNPVDTLNQIKFYEGEFTAQPGVKSHYVIAHELQAVLDYAVSGVKDAVTEDGNIVAQVVDYSKMVPILGAALQVALSRIAALEAKVLA